MTIKETLIIDDSQIEEAFKRMISNSEEAKAELGELTSDMQTEFNEAATAVDKFGSSTEDATKKIKKQGQEIKKEEGLLRKFKRQLKDNIREYKIFGVSIGSVADNLKKQRSEMNKSSKSSKGFGKALGGITRFAKGGALGAIALALGGLVAVFTRTQAGADKFNQILAGARSIFDNLIDRAASFGRAVIKLFKLDFKGAAEEAKATFSGLGAELVADAKAAAQLERRTQRLKDVNRELSVEFANQRARIEELRNIGEDTTRGHEERTKALADAIELENKLTEKRTAAAVENLAIIKEQNNLSNSLRADKDKEAQAEVELANIRADTARKNRENINKLNSLREEERRRLAEAAKLRRQQLEEERKRQEELKKAIEASIQALEKQVESSNLSLLSGKERVKEEERIAIEQANILEQQALDIAQTEAEKNQIRQLAEELRANIVSQANQKLADIDEDARLKTLELQKQIAESIKKATAEEKAEREKQLAERRRQLDLSETLALSEIDFIEESGSKILSLEQFKERERLKVRLEFLKARRSLLAQEKGLSSQEVQILDNQIKAIQASIDNINSTGAFEKFRNFFANTFGLNDEDLQFIGGQIDTIVDNFVEGIQTATQSQIDAVDARIAAIDQEISAQQKAVDEQIKRDKKGLASNLDTEKKKLDGLQKERKKAEDERIKLLKKSARQQLLIDVATQISALATASSKIFASESSKGLAGVLIAISAISTMFAAVTRFKAIAKKAATAQKLRKGAKLKGKRHEDGGIPLYVEGNMYEAEADEWLIGTGPSREHDKHLRNVNDNKYKGVDIDKAIRTGLTVMSTHRTKEFSQKKTEVDQMLFTQMLIEAADRNGEMIKKAIDERPRTYPPGTMVHEYKVGNKTVIDIRPEPKI